MSSEQEENVDHLDDPNANSSAAETNQSPEKRDNGGNEHAKPRRRRRGKKRKHKKESAATCEAENPDDCEGELRQHVEQDCESPTWDSDENLSCDVNTFTDVIIRPVNVPKAPENSTQFIMDDHNDCRFYMSFETPNPYLADPPHPDGEVGDIIEPVGEDAAYRDIDYQYESPQDFDNSAYYDREFELSYKNNRFDELMRLSRAELISAMQGSEIRLKELTDAMVKENPSPILEKLQAELLELQEKHSYLKECNSKLTALLQNDTQQCTENVVTPEALPGILSLKNNDTDNNEHSDTVEVFHECSESVEEVAMDVIAAQNCDKNSVELNSGGNQILPQQSKSNENSVNNLSVPDSEEEQQQQTKINLNSHRVHCQTKSIVKDDIRTLGINNSTDLFHAKCSSSVPHEGGMSPSETSVN